MIEEVFALLNLLTILRVISVCGLVFSAISVADTLQGKGAFCDMSNGCADVASSVFARPLGIPLSAIGCTGFGLFFALTLCPQTRIRGLVNLLAVAAGLTGVTLILIQLLVLHKICWVCVSADSCGICLMLIALIDFRRSTQAAIMNWRRRAGWLSIAVVAAFAPIVWSSLQPQPRQAPLEVKAHWVAGKITIVEVTDFDCPYCAKADKILGAALENTGDIHFVRLPAPMPQHANSRFAARAFLAAQRQGKGEEMAAALFAAESRAADDCRGLALSLRLKMDEYDQIISDPAIDAELDATIAWVRRFERLPLIWVQDRLFARVPSLAELQEAIRGAAPYRSPK